MGRTRHTPTATPRATTTSTSSGTRSAATATRFGGGWRIMSSQLEPHTRAAYTAAEMMTIAAARALPNGATCLVGIGLPGTAAILARRVHAPELVLVYESGPIGAKPGYLPLSIG